MQVQKLLFRQYAISVKEDLLLEVTMVCLDKIESSLLFIQTRALPENVNNGDCWQMDFSFQLPAPVLKNTVVKMRLVTTNFVISHKVYLQNSVDSFA